MSSRQEPHSLNHKSWNDAREASSLVGQRLAVGTRAIFSSAESSEVFGSSGSNLSISTFIRELKGRAQSKDDSTCGQSVNGNIEINGGGDVEDLIA